jgi:hydroxyacylglutathione hydrolase
MRIPLEDEFKDVVGKARRGLRLSESALIQAATLDPDEFRKFENGQADSGVVQRVADILHLDGAALVESGRASWYPQVPPVPATLAAFNTSFGDITVNSYLIWERDGGRAAAFDTGSDCAGMLQALQTHQLALEYIFLTHTHPDHIADLDKLAAKTGATVFVSALEKISKATPIHEGQEFTVGALTISARLTPGHSPGGLTYVIEGLSSTVAVVGDALFAGSMGGVTPDLYAGALLANRENILSLPDQTLICPGHGPMTTVGEEKRHNPFYANGAGITR